MFNIDTKPMKRSFRFLNVLYRDMAKPREVIPDINRSTEYLIFESSYFMIRNKEIITETIKSKDKDKYQIARSFWFLIEMTPCSKKGKELINKMLFNIDKTLSSAMLSLAETPIQLCFIQLMEPQARKARDNIGTPKSLSLSIVFEYRFFK